MATDDKKDRLCLQTLSIQVTVLHTYDNVDLDNNATVRDVWTRKYMFYIEDKHMNRALCKLFLSLVSPEIQRTFEEEMKANPNMKFKDMASSFGGTD